MRQNHQKKSEIDKCCIKVVFLRVKLTASMHKQITSLQNPLIKSLVVLGDKSKARKQTQTFLLEGQREISLAIQGGYQIQQLFYYKNLLPDTLEPTDFLAEEYIEVTKEVYEKIAYRSTTEGMIAVAKSKIMTLIT